MRVMLLLLTSALASTAHPSWGLVVDAERRIYFTDVVRKEVYRLDADGKIHMLARGVHSHDLVLRPDGRLRGEPLWCELQQDEFFSYGFDLMQSAALTRLPWPTVFDLVLRIMPDGRREPLGGVPFAGEKRGRGGLRGGH